MGEPGAPLRAAAEVALRRALLPDHPLAFVEPAPEDDPSGAWHALVAALLPDAGDVDLVLREPAGTPGPAIGLTRASATVATALRAGRSAPVLSGAAAEHADRAVAAALETLTALDERGWVAVVDQPLAVGSAGLGADAVAERTGAFDPLSVGTAAPA